MNIREDLSQTVLAFEHDEMREAEPLVCADEVVELEVQSPEMNWLQLEVVIAAYRAGHAPAEVVDWVSGVERIAELAVVDFPVPINPWVLIQYITQDSAWVGVMDSEVNLAGAAESVTESPDMVSRGRGLTRAGEMMFPDPRSSGKYDDCGPDGDRA